MVMKMVARDDDDDESPCDSLSQLCEERHGNDTDETATPPQTQVAKKPRTKMKRKSNVAPPKLSKVRGPIESKPDSDSDYDYCGDEDAVELEAKSVRGQMDELSGSDQVVGPPLKKYHASYAAFLEYLARYCSETYQSFRCENV